MAGGRAGGADRARTRPRPRCPPPGGVAGLADLGVLLARLLGRGAGPVRTSRTSRSTEARHRHLRVRPVQPSWRQIMSQLGQALTFAKGLYKQNATVAYAGYVQRDPLALLAMRP